MISETVPLVRLRALEPEDLDLLYTIENDKDIWDVSETNTPMSKFVLRQYLAAQPQEALQAGEIRLVVEDVANSRPVGLIDLTDISILNRRAEIGIALLKEERGKGYGREALRLMEAYARKNLRLRFLFCKISAEHNPNSKSLFESSGYKEIAVLPEWHYYEGKYEDLILYQKKM